VLVALLDGGGLAAGTRRSTDGSTRSLVRPDDRCVMTGIETNWMEEL
jgi:hypothetical protein